MGAVTATRMRLAQVPSAAGVAKAELFSWEHSAWASLNHQQALLGRGNEGAQAPGYFSAGKLTVCGGRGAGPTAQFAFPETRLGIIPGCAIAHARSVQDCVTDGMQDASRQFGRGCCVELCYTEVRPSLAG